MKNLQQKQTSCKGAKANKRRMRGSAWLAMLLTAAMLLGLVTTASAAETGSSVVAESSSSFETVDASESETETENTLSTTSEEEVIEEEAEEEAEEADTEEEEEVSEEEEAEEQEEAEEDEEEEEAEALTLTAETDTGVIVTVQTDEDAFSGSTKGYSLSVEELEEGTTAYNAHYEAAWEALQEGEGREIVLARFFDITIQDEKGREVEPATPAQVEISYDSPLPIEEEQELQVLHFADAEPEILPVSLDESSLHEDTELVEVISFEQGSFSVTGTVVTTGEEDYWRKGFPTSNGDYVVVVEYDGKYYALAAGPWPELSDDDPVVSAKDAHLSKGDLVPVTFENGEVTIDESDMASGYAGLVEDAIVWQYTWASQGLYNIISNIGANYLISSYGEPMGAYWRIYDNRGDHDNTLIYGSNLPRGLFWLDETTVTLNGETITYPAGLYASDTFVGSGGAITQNYNGAHGTNFTYMSVSPDNQTYITNNSRLVTAAKMHLVFDDPENPDVPTGWAFGSELADEGSTDRARGLYAGVDNQVGPSAVYFANKFSKTNTPAQPQPSKELDEPHVNKAIAPNNATIEGESGDGTYTLSLNVNGTSEDRYQKQLLDVLIVLDTSNSMAMPQQATPAGWVDENRRYDAAQTIISDFIKEMYRLNETDDTILTMNMFDFATFALNRDNSQWTNDLTSLETYLANTTNGPLRVRTRGVGSSSGMDGATNWEDALQKAKDTLANNNSSARTTLEPGTAVKQVVIFVTDGNPTVSDTRFSDTQPHNNNNNTYYGNGAEEPNNILYAFWEAKDDAKALVDDGVDLYAIGIYGGGGLLENLLAYAYSEDEAGTYPENHYYDARSTDQMSDAFKQLAKKLEGNLNFTDVKITDGITNLTSTALDTEPEAFVYYKWLEDGNRNIYDAEDIDERGFVKRYSNVIDPTTGKYEPVEPDSFDIFGNPVYSDAKFTSSFLPPAKYYYHTDNNGTVYYTWQLDDGVYYGPKDATGEYTIVFDEADALKIYNIYEKMDEDGNRWNLKDKVRNYSDADTFTWKDIEVTPAKYDRDNRTVNWDMKTTESYSNRLMDSTNDYVLGHNWTYAVTFPVWPSQEMYDYVSEWNNYDNTDVDANKKNLSDFASDKDSDPEVSKYVEQGKTITGKSGTYHEYTLLTNVENSAKLTYTQMSESSETVDGKTVSEIVKLDPKTIDYNPVDPIVVKDTQIKVTKYWEDLLDSSKLASLIEDDPDFEVELILLQASHDQDKGTVGVEGADGRMSYGPLYDEATGKWPTEYIYPHNPATPYTAEDNYEGAFKIKLKPIWHYYGETQLHGSSYDTVAEYYANERGESAPDETTESFDHPHVIVDGFEEGYINISVGLMVSNPEDFGAGLGNPANGYVEFVTTYPAGAPLPDGTWATSYGWAHASQETLDGLGMTADQLWANGYIVSASDKDTGAYTKGFPGATLNGIDRKGTVNADGSVTVSYYLLDEGYHYMLRETNRDYAFTLDAQTYHPFLIDGVLYDVNCDYVSNSGYVVSHIKDYNKTGNPENSYWLEETGLSATNKLRPHITLEKLILDGNNRFYYSKNTDGTVKTEEVYAPGHEDDAAYSTVHKIRPGNYSKTTINDGEGHSYAKSTGDATEQFHMFVELELPAKITNLGRINYAVYPEWWDQLVEEGKWTQDEEDAAINHIKKEQSYPNYTYITDGEDIWEVDDPDAPEKTNLNWYIIYGEIPMTPNERVRLYNIPVGTKVTVMENTEQMMADFGDKYELGFMEVDWAERQSNGTYGQVNNWFYGSDEMLKELEQSRSEYVGEMPANGWVHRNKGYEYDEEIFDDDGNLVGTKTVKEPAMVIQETVHDWDINYDIDVFNYFRPNVEMKKVDSQWDRKKLENNKLELTDTTDPAGKGEMIDDSKVKGLKDAKFTLYRVVAGDTPEEIEFEKSLLTEEEKGTLIDPNGTLTDEQKAIVKRIEDNLPNGQKLTNPFVIVTTKVHLSTGAYVNKKLENIETDENGKIDFGYLRDGVYYLVETKAPSGYALEDRITKITVGANIGDNDKDDAVTYQMLGTPVQKEEKAWCRTEYDTNSVEKKIYEIAVTDSHVYTLPSTGGPGTLWYTIFGTLFLTLAAWFGLQNLAERYPKSQNVLSRFAIQKRNTSNPQTIHATQRTSNIRKGKDMKKYKKLSALLLSLVMVIAMAMPAFAATADTAGTMPSNEDKVTVTVKDVEPGLTVTAYQIVKATYDDSGKNFRGFKVADESLKIGDVEGTDIKDLQDPTSEEVTKIAAKIAKGELTPATTQVLTDNGNNTYSYDLAPGYWLIKVSGLSDDNEKIYNPMLAGVYYTVDENGEIKKVGYMTEYETTKDADGNKTGFKLYTEEEAKEGGEAVDPAKYVKIDGEDGYRKIVALDPAQIDADSKWNLAGTDLYAKSSPVEVEKTVFDNKDEDVATNTDSNKNTKDPYKADNNSKHGDDHDIGDTVTFHGKATIPDYSEEYTDLVFKIKDTVEKDKLAFRDADGKEVATAAWVKLLVTGEDQTNSEYSDVGIAYNVTFNKQDAGKWVSANGDAVADEPTDKDAFKITFTEDNVFEIELNEYAIRAHGGEKVYIEYYAEILDGAGTNFDENTNEIEIEFTNSPETDDDGKSPTGKKKDITFHYTFELDGSLDGEESVQGGDKHGNQSGHELAKVNENFDENKNREITYKKQDGSTGTAVLATEGEKKGKYVDKETGAVAINWDEPIFTESEWANDPTKQGLAGAEFKLTPYTADDSGKVTVAGTIDDSNKDRLTTTTDAGGRLNFKGLDAGYYLLEETKAPAGYSLNPNKTVVLIDAKYYDANTYYSAEPDLAKADITDDMYENIDYDVVRDDNGKITGYRKIQFHKGELMSYEVKRAQLTPEEYAALNGDLSAVTNWTETTEYKEERKIDNGVVDHGITTTVTNAGSTFIRNTKTPVLPSTGGMGTYLFTIIGVAIIGVAAFLLTKKRHNEK